MTTAHTAFTAALIPLTAVKVKNLRINVPTGYQLLSGWTLIREDGTYLADTDGSRPYFPRGGKSAVDAIVTGGGVYEGAKFVSL